MKQFHLWPAFWKISPEIGTFLTFVQLPTHITYTKDLSFSHVGTIHLESVNRLFFTFLRLWKKEISVCFDQYYNKRRWIACVLSCLPCPTLRDPMDCSLPGCSVHEILQARILEWIAQFCAPPGIFPTQRSNLCLLHWQAGSLLLVPLGKPNWKRNCLVPIWSLYPLLLLKFDMIYFSRNFF